MNLKKIAAGFFSMALLASGGMMTGMSANAYASRYLGDLDQDNTLSVKDIILMQKYLLGRQEISDQILFDYADLNRDNKVNVYDFIMLKRSVLSGNWLVYVTEDPSEPTTEEPSQEPTEETTEPTTEITTDPVETTEPATEADTFLDPPIKKTLHNLPSQGNANLVIFYVDFPDCKYDYSPSAEEIEEIAFGEEDTSDSNFPFDSMTAFYNRSSKGAMKLSGKVFRYTAKNNLAYYTETKTLLLECYAAFNDSVDFSKFDGDGDKKIDATLVSVPKKAGDDLWWPCAGDSGLTFSVEESIDGMQLGHFISGNAQIESASDYKNFNSSYLHEMGHCMGLPDYYLYYSEDGEGFHGETNTAGLELMDMDASTDFCCFSKLMLGWYKGSQISVYNLDQGGEQTFVLNNAQTDAGNCLILPYGKLNNYCSEYLILEYITSEGNNSSSVYNWLTSGNGIRAYHIKADLYNNGWWTSFKYENGGEKTNNDDAGIRLIRLTNDAEGGDIFTAGQVLDGNLSGWHWYDPNENESIDTGYSVTIGELKDGQYTVTVNKN